MSKPNIIFILADDLGPGDLGCYGNPDVMTPYIDSLAADGVRLTQHYAGSPVCAPSRAALMTGRYPHRTGAIDTLEGRGLDRLALREVTMADVLKKAGYATGLIGKWHLGALDDRYHPNRRGFDEFCGFRGGWSDYWQWRLDYNGTYRASTELSMAADGHYLTDVFTEEAVDFVRRHHNEPFFLHLTYNAPHFPLQVPDEDADLFRKTGKFTEGVSLIYGMAHRMDTGIGRIMEELEKQGIAQNTIIVFASDNGPQFGAGNLDARRYNLGFNGGKGVTYEGGIRVPAVLRWPDGLEAGMSVHDMVHFTDWLPTFASIAGVSVPTDRLIDGCDVMSVLRGECTDGQAPRFWQWNRYSPVGTCNAGMRDGDWKLIRPLIKEAMGLTQEDLAMDHGLKYEAEKYTDICRDPEPERVIPDPPEPLLFNLRSDPCEQNDVAADNPDLVKSMQCELDRWFESVEAERLSIKD